MKWAKLARMNNKRTLYASMPRVETFLFALGGNVNGNCECLDLATGKWRELRSYEPLVPHNDLQTFSMFLY